MAKTYHEVMGPFMLLVLLDLAALTPQEAGPRVIVESQSARTVRVRGSGFEPGEQVHVMVDPAEPHASIACRGDRSEYAKANQRGTFVVAIAIPTRDCALRAGERYLIWADWKCGLDCSQGWKGEPFTAAASPGRARARGARSARP
jgi:hypothetical protein